MDPNVRIDKVSLFNFRNHENTELANLKSFIVLNGKNGSGKTSILEAISFFAPGRGIKNTGLVDIVNRKKIHESCQLKINLKYKTGNIELKRYFSIDHKNNNFISVDEEKINNSQLLDFLNIIWITPIMEKIMLQSNSEKRNFFDRLIFNINKKHIKNHTKLQKLLSERLLVIKKHTFDNDWLSIIENSIAELSYEIMIAREKFIASINQKLKAIKPPFNSCIIDMIHELSNSSINLQSSEFIEEYKNILYSNRRIDSELGRTTKTINKVKIDLYNNLQKELEAKNCSTGEQKSILLSIFISVANLVKQRNNGRSPIILIDEAMAHLDSDHKECLFRELANLNSQVWFTGVSKDLFKNINDQTDFFDMKNIIQL